ncbi:MAG: aminotransferase class III-fold pyridoxal phosphate-dependent enzyme, partial [Candidatus Dormibacteria bacterium]
PLGGVIISSAVAETFAERIYPGGLTYSGHPLACAAGVATIRVFEETDLLARVRRLGQEVVAPALERIRQRHPSVGEVRGRGLLWALDLVRDRDTREMLVPYNASGPANQPMTELAQACRQRGLWPFTHFNRVHVAPPLVIEEEELAQGLEILDQALELADRHYRR